MPDQITTAAELEDLLCGLNEDGHEPYLLAVDSRPKPALEAEIPGVFDGPARGRAPVTCALIQHLTGRTNR